MRLKWWLIGVVGLVATGVRGGTPMNAPLAEDGITSIECEWDAKPMTYGKWTLRSKPGTYHYKVYVPAGYSTDTQRRYPCLFVASPGGNATMGAAGERLRRDRWIVVMLVESKNGPWNPILSNFASAHDDAVKRLRIQPGFLVATGMSGGARASSVNAGVRPGFVGLILQGAGFGHPETVAEYTSAQRNPGLAIIGTFGNKDPNLKEAEQLRKGLPKTTRYTYEVFPGGHVWAPREVMEWALDWIEEWMYVQAPPQPKARGMYVQRFKDVLEASTGEEVSDFRRWEMLEGAVRMVVARGLGSEAEVGKRVGEVKATVAKLAAEPAVKAGVAAKEAFVKARAMEEKARGEAGDLREVRATYSAVAAQFGETEYGKRAGAKAGMIEAELE